MGEGGGEEGQSVDKVREHFRLTSSGKIDEN